MKKLKVLVGCEESQAVCIAFRERGHEAYSCDIQECSGGHPEWHLQMDVFEAIELIKPDMGIFFPPCTHIANAGGNHFAQKRADGRQEQAIKFFARLLSTNIRHIALENPVGILCGNYIHKYFPHLINKELRFPRTPDQVIQPFHFGDYVRKYTCLWLKNLPPLIHTNEVVPEDTGKFIVRKGAYRTGKLRKLYWYDSISSKGGSKKKSKTFPGIANAMAAQWGNLSNKKYLVQTELFKQQA